MRIANGDRWLQTEIARKAGQTSIAVCDKLDGFVREEIYILSSRSDAFEPDA